MDCFEKAINHVMLSEVGPWFDVDHPACKSGSIATKDDRRATGYVVYPDDTGGETKFGIAKNANPTVDIAKLTYAQAKDIYRRNYWGKCKCPELPERLAIHLFDAAVNHGTTTAIKMLQRAVNVPDDGDLGPKTLAAVKALPEKQVVYFFIQHRRNFYLKIVERNPSQMKFLKGWMNRIENLEKVI